MISRASPVTSEIVTIDRVAKRGTPLLLTVACIVVYSTCVTIVTYLPAQIVACPGEVAMGKVCRTGISRDGDRTKIRWIVRRNMTHLDFWGWRCHGDAQAN